MKRANWTCWMFVLIAVVVGGPESGFAQTASGETAAAGGIANEFDYFLTNVDSRQVVTDLRNGQWTTSTVAEGAATPTTSTEALPTGKMGWGNVKISLALAQHSLSQQGIYQPTQQELYTALMGGQMGDSTTVNGVLQMRADGMGWGEIAKHYGVTVGDLVRNANGTNQGITGGTTAGTESEVAKASGKPSGGEDGIITGSGQVAGVLSSIATGRGHGYGLLGDYLYYLLR